jgi:hypothetical protein
MLIKYTSDNLIEKKNKTIFEVVGNMTNNIILSLNTILKYVVDGSQNDNDDKYNQIFDIESK